MLCHGPSPLEKPGRDTLWRAAHQPAPSDAVGTLQGMQQAVGRVQQAPAVSPDQELPAASPSLLPLQVS